MRDKQIQAKDAGKSLILLGLLIGVLGFGLLMIKETVNFGTSGYYYPITIQPYLFIGATLMGLGINCFIGGLLLHSVSKDIANDGILLAFLFGGMGVFFWLLFSHPENKILTFPTHTEEAHKHCPNCNMMVPCYSVQYCPHCGQKLDQTKPSYAISEVKQ